MHSNLWWPHRQAISHIMGCVPHAQQPFVVGRVSPHRQALFAHPERCCTWHRSLVKAAQAGPCALFNGACLPSSEDSSVHGSSVHVNAVFSERQGVPAS